MCPPKTVTPPPVNIPAPDDTPTACVPSLIMFNSSIQALNNIGTGTTTTTANMRTPVPTQPPNVSSTINITFSARSHGMYNNSSTGTADNPIVTQPSNNSSTEYPPENIILTQPPTYNSHLYNAAKVSESNALMHSYI